MLVAQKRVDEARADYRAAAALLEALTRTDPTASGWSADYAVALCKAAAVGDEPKANFARALALFDALIAKARCPATTSAWIDEAKAGLAALGAN